MFEKAQTNVKTKQTLRLVRILLKVTQLRRNSNIEISIMTDRKLRIGVKEYIFS